MREPKTGYMSQLDDWTAQTIVKPLIEAARGEEGQVKSTLEKVQEAIRGKVLESYRNGQKAKPAARKEKRRWNE